MKVYFDGQVVHFVVIAQHDYQEYLMPPSQNINPSVILKFTRYPVNMAHETPWVHN
jgi:hypothetical protein